MAIPYSEEVIRGPRTNGFLGFVRLDDVPEDATPGLIAEIGRSTRMTVGLATQPLGRHLDPLLDSCDFTLTAVPTPDRRCVHAADLDTEADRVALAAADNPQASLVLGRLLRQTAQLPVDLGLAAEAANYSMLLGGSEFRSWLDSRGPARHRDISSAPLILVERSADDLTITLNRPERRNALGFALRDELYDALGLATLDETISRVHLVGAGPAFCSGGDLDEFGTATDLVAAFQVRLERAPWRLIHELRQRITVTVQGTAIGAGIEMAAFAGWLRATRDATFVLPEVRMGLVPGAGGSVSVPRRIGRWRAAWLMLTGTPLNAETALEWGLVDEVVSS